MENEMRLDAQDLNQQGVLLLKTGNLEAAEEKFTQAIEKDPMVMDSYKNYGDLYMALEDYESAKNMYKKAMLIEKSGLLHFLYGNACFMNDQLYDGVENYNLAIKEGFDNDEMMFFMGMAYEQMNDDDMALRYFQKACTKNPTKAEYLVKKIGVLVRMGMYDEAEEECNRLLDSSPEVFDGYHIKTQLLLHKEAYEEAAVFSKGASDKFPEDADLLYDYAKALSLGGKLEAALQVIGTAKTMKYFHEAKLQFTLLEGQIYAEQNEIERAKECCRMCIDMETADSFEGEARFMLMNLHLVEPAYDKALEQAEQVVKRNEKDIYYYAALYYRAFCTKQMGKAEEAQAMYKEAGMIYRLATLENPEALDIYLYRAMCLKDMELYDKALEMLDFVAGISDEIAEIHVLKADVYQLEGRKNLAQEELQKAYRLKPELEPKEERVGK